jgi:hypothetical protein
MHYNIRDLNSVESSTAQFPLIGYTVFWRLAGIRVSHPDLERALLTTSFSDHLPDPPSPRVALRRALEAWVKDKQRAMQSAHADPLSDEEPTEDESASNQRTLIRVINRAGSEHLVYALIAEDVDFGLLGLSYGTALRILLHKKTGAMICTTEAAGVIDAQHESQRVADELAPYWQQYRDLFIARDLSQMMRGIIDGMNAIPLRRAGGVYFVPHKEREPLMRLRSLLTDIPQLPELPPFVCALGVPDALETRRSLAKAVHAGLLDEIGSLRGDLERLMAGGERVREKTIAQRLSLYQRLRAKAGMYQELLGMQQDQVRAAIRELEAEARQLLTAGDHIADKPVTFTSLPFESAVALAL